MPYVEKLSLEGADHAARAAEIYGLVDGALTAHPNWSKVTDGYAGNTNFDAIDVWENDGTTDGYGWYLMVGMGASSQSKYQGRVLLGGALEYDPATNVAKKALRGYSSAGNVDADGYPLVSAGGAEMEFPLSGAYAASSQHEGQMGGANTLPATAAGQWVRVLVTGRAAWIGWGTPTTLAWSHAVGTYTNMHSAVADQKPLAFQAVNYNTGPTTVWQHPSATDTGTSRSNTQYYNTTSPFMVSAASALYGEVGATVDLLHGGPVGSRLAVQRYYASSRESPTSYMSTAGGFLGLSPKEFLIFDRAAGVQIGDTVTVDGKAYVSVDNPSNKPSLFVCTEPEA